MKIRVVSMMRSGTHAVVNWITKQLSGSTVHFNNACECKNCTPEVVFYQDGVQLGDVDYNGREYGRKQLNLPPITDPPKYESPWFYVKPVLTDNIVYNIENADPYLFKSLIKGKPDYDVLIIRDAYNMFASRYQRCKSYTKNGKDAKNLNLDNSKNHVDFISQKQVNLWKNYAKIFLDNKYDQKIKINFNKWFEDKIYRDEICLKMGLKNEDNGIQDVVGLGDGSSFDRTKYCGKAQLMKVNERWKYFQFDKAFLDIFDEETHYLNEKIFGFKIKNIKFLL